MRITLLVHCYLFLALAKLVEQIDCKMLSMSYECVGELSLTYTPNSISCDNLIFKSNGIVLVLSIPQDAGCEADLTVNGRCKVFNPDMSLSAELIDYLEQFDDV